MVQNSVPREDDPMIVVSSLRACLSELERELGIPAKRTEALDTAASRCEEAGKQFRRLAGQARK